MKKIKLIFGLTIIIGLMACSKSSNEVKATTQLNDLFKQELTKQDKKKYNYFYNNAIKNSDATRSSGGSGGTGTGPGSAPSYITVNLGIIGNGFSQEDASIIATNVNSLNIRRTNGCTNVQAAEIVEMPLVSNRYYIKYSKIISNVSDFISANGNIVLINALTTSCACGQGGATSQDFESNITGYVVSSSFVINTIAYTSINTSYCF